MPDDSILLSVSKMEEDGHHVYFNTDNSTGKKNIILLADGTIIPFAKKGPCFAKLSDKALVSQEEPAVNEEPSHQEQQVSTNRRSCKTPSLIHCSLGHCGSKRLKLANIIIDGSHVKEIEVDETTCRGCRLGNCKTHRRRWKTAPAGSSRVGFARFGQQVHSDISLGYPASFPHGFKSMMNFKD